MSYETQKKTIYYSKWRYVNATGNLIAKSDRVKDLTIKECL